MAQPFRTSYGRGGSRDMSSRNLEHLFGPRSVAVIGAFSSDRAVAQYAAEIWTVGAAPKAT